MDNKRQTETCFRVSTDPLVTKQLATYSLEPTNLQSSGGGRRIDGNHWKLQTQRLSDQLAQELNIQEEAKSLKMCTKSHLADSQGRGKRGAAGGVDSAKENLASTFCEMLCACWIWHKDL